MLKKIFFALIALLPFVAFAQNNNTGIPIPMKNSIVFSRPCRIPHRFKCSVPVTYSNVCIDFSGIGKWLM